MSQTPAPNGASIALFSDFENIAHGVHDASMRFDVQLVLERLLEKGNVLVKRAYCDWDRFRDYKRQLHEAAFELVEVPRRGLAGKNSADIRLVVDVLDLSHNKPHIDTYVIMSGDSDFSPLVSKLRENDKHVIGIGVKGSTSELLVANCDEFLFYDDIVRESTRVADGEALPDRLRRLPEERRDAFVLMVAAIRGLQRENKDILWGSMIKQAMKRKRPSFDEGAFGYASFSKLLEDARRHELVALRRDERSGGYIVEEIAEDLLR